MYVTQNAYFNGTKRYINKYRVLQNLYIKRVLHMFLHFKLCAE